MRDSDEFHRLGMRDMFPISAEHGRGIDDLLDAILQVIPVVKLPTAESSEAANEAASRATDEAEAAAAGLVAPEEPHEIKVAIIGHPNVGKSTLLNQLDRKIPRHRLAHPRHHPRFHRRSRPLRGRDIRFIDTAGIRRKGKTHLMAEKLSVVMSRKNIEDADIVLFMIDATEGVSGLDATIAGYAHESGRSMIILVNKWDLIASGEKRAISQSKTARIQDAKRPAGSRRSTKNACATD